MAESWRTKFARWSFNLFPAYRRIGGKITYISHDWHEVRIKLPLNWKTRNYVGSIFGGSLYGAVDPMYMIMLIKILGPNYVVWDKAAKIQFKNPGRSTLYAAFLISNEEIETIKKTLESESAIDRIYIVDLKDANGKVYTTVEKTIYISKKETR